MPKHGPKGRGGMEKAKDFKGTIKRIFKYMGAYKISLFFVFIFSIGSAIFSIVGPKILGRATTEIFNGLVGKVMGTTAGINFEKIAGILLTLLGLYLISMIFSYIQGFIMTGVGQKITYTLREQISNKFHKLPLKYYESQTTGEILSRVTNDVDTVSQTLDQVTTQLLSQITMIVGIFLDRKSVV